MSSLRQIPWPPSTLAIATVLLIGAALVLCAIALRRRDKWSLSNITLALAALWNAAIVFAFMSPRNRHVFHLATHRSSVIVNAAIGLTWLALCLWWLRKWHRPRV